MAMWGLGLGWRWLALLLDLAGWIVYLVALSILQHRCSGPNGSAQNTFGEAGGVNDVASGTTGGFNSGWTQNGLTPTNQLIGASDYFGTPSKCRYLYSFPWWLFAFQFFLVVLYAVLHTTRRTYGWARGPLAALTAYGLYLATQVTDIFFQARYSAFGVHGNLNKPLKAAFAGALIMAAAKGFMLLGLLFPHDEEETVGRKVTKVEATTYAPTTTTAAAPVSAV